VLLADCCDDPESTTVTPKEKFPLFDGVPDITPVLAARVSPAGSCPVVTLHT
jgi:hypothetical protein